MSLFLWVEIVKETPNYPSASVYGINALTERYAVGPNADSAHCSKSTFVWLYLKKFQLSFRASFVTGVDFWKILEGQTQIFGGQNVVNS